MAVCSACEADIDVDEFDVDRGDQISCSECGGVSIVATLSPVTLESHLEEGEAESDENPVGEGDSEWD
jgi:alpha-aminoadipate carrier protein LysW